MLVQTGGQKCQEVMAQARQEEVKVQKEAQGWAELEEEEWGGPEWVQAQEGNVFVPIAEQRLLMRLAFLVLLRNVQNVGRKW